MKRTTTSWSQNRDKARLQVTLPKGLKKQVTQMLKYSSLTRSDLVEEKFREFLREEKNMEVIQDEMSEFVCECGALMTEAGLDKNSGDCPSCGKKIEKKWTFLSRKIKKPIKLLKNETSKNTDSESIQVRLIQNSERTHKQSVGYKQGDNPTWVEQK